MNVLKLTEGNKKNTFYDAVNMKSKISSIDSSQGIDLFIWSAVEKKILHKMYECIGCCGKKHIVILIKTSIEYITLNSKNVTAKC